MNDGWALHPITWMEHSDFKDTHLGPVHPIDAGFYRGNHPLKNGRTIQCKGNHPLKNGLIIQVSE